MSSIPPSDQPAERPMNVFEATLWAIGSVVALGMLMQGSVSLMPSLRHDTAAFSICQLIAYLALLLVIQTVYFPKTRAATIFGLRGGSWIFYPIATLLGIAIHLPADAIYEAALLRWPDTSPSSEIFRGFPELPLWRKIATGVGLIVTTPLIEEAFFRGALFGTLRRRYGAAPTVVSTALLFAFIHIQPQAFLPIGIVGASLAFMRVASGSMWPGVLLHMTFNAVTFYALLQGSGVETDAPESFPTSWVVAGSVVTAGLLALTDFLRVRYNKDTEPKAEAQS